MQPDLVARIRAKAKELLTAGQVEAVYGFAQASVPMGCRPFVARSPKEAERLWWDEFCVLNLVNFLPRRTGAKFAVAAKGCDARNLVVHHLEKQIDLNNQVTILGLPCQGMIDRHLIYETCPGELISEVQVADGRVKVRGVGLDKEFPLEEVKREACRTCRYPTPILASDLLGEPIPSDPNRDKDARVREIEKLSPSERQEFFKELFSPCIRCYACRDACPLCYCQTCFVDESRPQWLGKANEPSDVLTYHFLRAFHCAGRCTDCGACESACPVHIPVRVLTRKLEKDIQAAYGHQAGLDAYSPPPMSVFKPDDPDEGFM